MYTKTQLKEKLEKKGIYFPAGIPGGYFANLRIDPIYEDENGEEYFDDKALNVVFENCKKHEHKNINKEEINKDFLNSQIERLINENKHLAQKVNNIQDNVSNNLISTQENVQSGVELNSFMADLKKMVEMFVNELKDYSYRTVEAEKKLYLLEDNERRIKEQYFELNSEVKRLHCELEDKNKKLSEIENYKKKLNNIEIQLKLLQIKQNKKKFWEFWK